MKFLGRTAKIQYDDFTANFYCDNCSHSSHNLFISSNQKLLQDERVRELIPFIFKSGTQR